MVWKSVEHRRENAARWTALWNAEKITELKMLFTEKGETYDFAEDAFEPFFQSLEIPPVSRDEPQDNVLFEQLKSRFVAEVDGESRIFSFFPDEPELIDALAGSPDVFVISRSAIAVSLAKDYGREFGRVTLVALLGSPC